MGRLCLSDTQPGAAVSGRPSSAHLGSARASPRHDEAQAEAPSRGQVPDWLSLAQVGSLRLRPGFRIPASRRRPGLQPGEEWLSPAQLGAASARWRRYARRGATERQRVAQPGSAWLSTAHVGSVWAMRCKKMQDRMYLGRRTLGSAWLSSAQPGSAWAGARGGGARQQPRLCGSLG